jgi:hypothetical protein
LLADWTAHGPDVLQRVRMTDPSTYLRVAFAVIPRDVALTVEHQGPGNLNPSLWSRLRPILDLIEQHAPADADPAEVLETVEHALRSQFATPIDHNG